MPIKGVSEIRRFPRIGKIRLGIKKVSQKGNEYPSQTDYFVVDPEDGVTSPVAAAAFTKVYGPKPREIDILFPTDDRAQLFPQWLKRYGSGSGLVCKGDGEQAQAVNKETGELVDVTCNPEECPAYKADPPQCRRVGSLQFLLPQVPGLGVWVVETTSWYSIVNLNSGMEFISCLTGGRIAMIPLKLRLKPQEVAPGGKKKIVHVLALACEHIRLQDVLAAAQQPAVAALMPTLDETKPPDDLYARSVREGTPPPSKPEGEEEPEEEAPELPADIVQGFQILGWTEAKVKATLTKFEGDLDAVRAYISAEVDRRDAADKPAPAARRRGNVTPLAGKTPPAAPAQKAQQPRTFF